MERFRSTTIGSFFTATLFAGAILLGGCSDSLTGATPSDANEDTTIQQRAQHNTNAQDDDDDSGGDTSPAAGHNTSDQD
jgi:hypothetical protein